MDRRTTNPSWGRNGTLGWPALALRTMDRRWSKQRRIAGAISSVLLMSLLAGCGSRGPALGRVTGRVTLDGKPLADARIVFQPRQKGAPSVAVTDKDGRYELVYLRDHFGAVLGEHTVTISTFRQLSGTEGSRRSEIPERVPARYNDETDLVRRVNAGAQTIDFELEGAPES